MTKTDYLNLQGMITRLLKKEIYVEYIHGYLTAILCAPEIIPPSSWLPLIFAKDREEPVFESQEEINSLIAPIMNMYNDIAQEIMDRNFKPLYSIESKNSTPEIAKIWCKGFILGLNLWTMNFTEDEDAKSFILPVLLIADSKKIMDSIPKESREEYNEEKIKELKKLSIESIPGNIIKLRHHNQYDSFTSEKKKVGRNEKCPCGSGKKYKHCCG